MIFFNQLMRYRIGVLQGYTIEKKKFENIVICHCVNACFEIGISYPLTMVLMYVFLFRGEHLFCAFFLYKIL